MTKYRWILITTPAYNQPFGVVIAKSHRWFPTFSRCSRNARKYYKTVMVEGEEQKPIFAIETKDEHPKAKQNMPRRPKNKSSV